MSQEECVSSTTDNQLMTVDAAKPGQTCNRRYSEVMQEYLRRKRHRNGNIDDTNIKPSEVLIRQADHTGPDGFSYVRWENLDNPGILNAQVPVVEDTCKVCDVQQKYCSPGLSPFSPVTPESGTDSFNTAKSQFSSIHSTSLPLTTNISPDGSSPDLAERYFLPSSNKSSAGLDTFRPKDSHTPTGLKAPVINVYSSGGSPKTEHTKEECGESESLVVQPFHSLSNTYVIKDKCRTFKEGTSLASSNKSVQSEVSLIREAPQGSNENLLSPMTLDFDMDSFSSELCYCYPPEEKDVSSFTLKHTPLHFTGSDGSPTFTAPSSNRQGNRRPMSQASFTARRRKLQRLYRCAWSLIVLGIIIIFTAVLIYFILE